MKIKLKFGDQESIHMRDISEGERIVREMQICCPFCGELANVTEMSIYEGKKYWKIDCKCDEFIKAIGYEVIDEKGGFVIDDEEEF